jgi:hypothetical protein
MFSHQRVVSSASKPAPLTIEKVAPTDGPVTKCHLPSRRQRRFAPADLEEQLTSHEFCSPPEARKKSLAFVFVWFELEGGGLRGKAPAAIRPIRRAISWVGGEIRPIHGPIYSDALEFVCST